MVVATGEVQGWNLLRNGVVLFDAGEFFRPVPAVAWLCTRGAT